MNPFHQIVQTLAGKTSIPKEKEARLIPVETRTRRASAYCLNPDCILQGKSTFLLGGGYYSCEKCKKPCLVESERMFRLNDAPQYREVRVEFNFDPDKRHYRGLAIVRDESTPLDWNVLTMYSPIMVTPKRASAHAERALGFLQMAPAEEAAFPQDFLIDWDKPLPQVRIDLEELQYRLHYAGKLSGR